LKLQSKCSSMNFFMTLPSREGPHFSEAGYYQPLDDYLDEAPESYMVDDFSPSAIDSREDADGKARAVPINIEGPVLYYRTDVFDELGLDVPASIEDVLAAAEAIKKKGDITPITLRGAAAAIAFDFGPFLHGEGVEWTKEDGTANFDNP